MDKYELFYAFTVNLQSARIKKELSLLQSLLLFTIALLPYLEKKDFNLNILTYDLWFMDKDIMENVKSWQFDWINVNSEWMLNINSQNYINVDSEYQRLSNKMIMWLVNENKDIINYSSSQVVDLMHKWTPYTVAKGMNVNTVYPSLLISSQFRYYI